MTGLLALSGPTEGDFIGAMAPVHARRRGFGAPSADRKP